MAVCWVGWSLITEVVIMPLVVFTEGTGPEYPPYATLDIMGGLRGNYITYSSRYIWHITVVKYCAYRCPGALGHS